MEVERSPLEKRRWQEEEDEEDGEEVALRSRQYRKPDVDVNVVDKGSRPAAKNGIEPEASAVTNAGEPEADLGGVESEASAVTDGSEPAADHAGIEFEASAGQKETEEADHVELENENGDDNDEEIHGIEENGGGGISSSSVSSVYFDKLEGIGTEPTNGDLEVKPEIIQSVASSTQCGKTMASGTVSGLSPSPAEESFEAPEAGPKHFHQRTDVDEDVDLIEEIEEEFMELDVEGVLKKQNTHHLYCPNCNSCITRKVILVRRKPKIRRKRKPERQFDDNPTYAADAQGPENVSSDSSPTPAPDEHSNNGEREAFRCLSCLSFFIPTGNGFRIFKASRESRKDENTLSPEKIPAGRTNWFFSIFAPGKSKIALEQAPSLSEVGPINQHVPSQSLDHLSTSHKNDRLDASSNRTPGDMGESADPSMASNAMESEANGETVKEIVSDHKACFPLVKGGSTPPESFGQGGQIYDGVTESKVGSINSSTEVSMLDEGEKADDAMVEMNVGGSTPTISFARGRQVYDGVTGPRKSVNDITNSSTEVSILVDVGEKSDNAMVENNLGHTTSAKGAVLPTHSSSNGGRLDDIATRSHESGISISISSLKGSPVLEEEKTESVEKSGDALIKTSRGDDLMVVIGAGSVGTTDSQRIESTAVSTESGAIESRGLDILKSIVYGGLIESITSLGVVSSAAGASASTLNILALGLANLMGGLFIIVHNLRELKNEQSGGVSSETNKQENRYQQLLGRRDNFALHATVSILSYLIFGVIPPVVYGFSFRQSNNGDLKLASVAAASLVCIILLAIGKAHVGRPQRTYFKTVLYYVIIGFMASGVSYLVGELLKKLFEELGWFDSSSALTTSFPEAKPLERPWGILLKS